MLKKQSEPVNILHDIHSCFLNAPITLRDRICEECNMSMPTYYRKMKTGDSQDEKRTSQVFSNVTKECILKVADLMVKNITDCLDKYRKQPE